jgi:WD40 repeat protein
VYAIGVLLFELLAERLPHPLDDVPLPEAARIICEEPAPRLASIDRRFRGDLDTIVARALDKTPERRYRSVADLGEDVRRYLEDRPIAARDDSALYLLRRQIRRYRSTVAVGAVSIIALSGLILYVSTQARRNERLASGEAVAKTEALVALKAAKEARERADAAARRLADELAFSNTERGRLYARTGKIGQAEDLLWPQFLASPGPGSAMWALWDMYSRHPCLATVHGHQGTVWSMQFASHGPRVFSGGADRSIHVWDGRTGERVKSWTGAHRDLYDLRLSPDDRVLAAAHADGAVVLWDVESGTVRFELPAHAGGALCVAFSPDGTRLISGGMDKALRAWDVATGRALGTLLETDTSIRALAWSRDGGRIAASAGGRKVWLLDPAGAAPPVAVPMASNVNALDFRADGGAVITGADDWRIRLLDPATGAVSGFVDGPSGVPRWLRLSGDGTRLFAACWWSVEAWSMPGMSSAVSLSIGRDLYSGAVNADGTLIATGHQNGWIRFWNLAEPGAVRRLEGHARRAAAAVAPDGRLVATGDDAGVIRLWSTDSCRLLARLAGHDGAIHRVRFSEDGRLVVTSDEKGVVKTWDVATGSARGTLGGARPSPGGGMGVRPGKDQLAVLMADGSLALARLPELSVDARHPAGDRAVDRFSFTRDGAAALLSDGSRAWYWRPDGADQGDSPAPPMLGAVSFRSDMREILQSGGGEQVLILDAKTGTRLGGIGSSSDFVGWTGYAPDDTIVVSGTDGAIRLYDPVTRRERLTLEGLGRFQAQTISISRDGRYLVASGLDPRPAVIDLWQFRRNIAGNALYQLERLRREVKDRVQPQDVRDWVESVLRPTSSDEPTIPGVSPETVAEWGRATLIP